MTNSRLLHVFHIDTYTILSMIVNAIELISQNNISIMIKGKKTPMQLRGLHNILDSDDNNDAVR